MGQSVKLDFLWAGLCMAGAVFLFFVNYLKELFSYA